MTPRAKYRLWSLLWILTGFVGGPLLATLIIPSPWNWLLLPPIAACGLLGIKYANKADRTYGWPMPKDWEAELNRHINERRSQQ